MSISFTIPRLPMKCGSYEAEIRKYDMYVGKSGDRWLVSTEPNCADHIYVEGGKGSQGFAGRELSFTLRDGSTLALKGPWHSNSTALFEDTGIDVRDKHLTFGVIAEDRLEGALVGILHLDKAWVIGPFDRIEKKAQEMANKLGKTLYCYRESQGGSSCGPIKPKNQT